MGAWRVGRRVSTGWLGWLLAVAWVSSGACSNGGTDEAPLAGASGEGTEGAVGGADSGGSPGDETLGGAPPVAGEPHGGQVSSFAGGGECGGGACGASTADPAVSGASGAEAAGTGGDIGAAGAPSLGPGQCLTTGQCEPHQQCQGGRAVPLCVSNHDAGICSSDEYSDGQGHCIAYPAPCEPCLPDLAHGFQCGALNGQRMWCNSVGRCVGTGNTYSCTDDRECVPSDVPPWNVGNFYCNAGTCAKYPTDCEDGNLCDGCCVRSLEDGADGCVRYANAGESCSAASNHCGPGLYCDTQLGACRAAGEEGASCSRTAPQPSSDDQCYLDMSEHECALGFRCNRERGACETIHPPCGSHGPCGEGETCVMAQVVGTCESDGANVGTGGDGGAGGGAAAGGSVCAIAD
jgi:hypothetical protein